MNARETRDEVVTMAVRLALGRPCSALSAAEWSRVFVVAGVERLATLAWLRSGEAIRACAPPAVVQTWRAHVVSAIAQAERQWAALLECVRLLEESGVDPVVLKGLPLAWRLYGDIAARESVDMDLFVPHAVRGRATSALRAGGWAHDADQSGWVGSFSRDGLHLEVHSSLFWDAIAHSTVPEPQASQLTLRSASIPTHGGAVLPAYLAANLAKHSFPPLRGWVDLHTLWSTLSPVEQAEALGAARRLRLARCLRWGLAGAARMVAVAVGNDRALTNLGFKDAERADVHPYLRAIALSDSIPDAIRVIGATLWPRPERRGSGALFRVIVRRMKKPIRRTLRPVRSYW